MNYNMRIFRKDEEQLYFYEGDTFVQKFEQDTYEKYYLVEASTGLLENSRYFVKGQDKQFKLYHQNGTR